jgi:hypothetical protein
VTASSTTCRASRQEGRAALDALASYLDAFGMRCVGEIDIADAGRAS